MRGAGKSTANPRLFLSAVFGVLLAATAMWPAAALPILPDLGALAGHVTADELPIVPVRDICGVHYEGRTKVTRYCDPPYVCDRANPGKCKPGAELQRQLDAERQRREEALRAAQQRLDQMRRDVDARLRNLRRTTRTTYFARTPTPTVRNDRRASNCNWENNLGSRALYCGNSNNDRIIPSPQYGPSRPSVARPAYGGGPHVTQRVPTVRTPTVNVRPPSVRQPSLRTILTLRLDVRHLESMARNDPDRAEWQNRIIAKAKAFEAQGEDVAPALKEMIDDMNARVAARERAEHGAVTDNTPPPPAETPAPQPQAAAAPPKPYSEKDEALCSYLMTLAPDQRDDRGSITRLGQPVPAYCQPYLRSLPKPPEAEAVPAFYLPEREREEARQMADEFYRENVLPPGYGQ